MKLEEDLTLNSKVQNFGLVPPNIKFRPTVAIKASAHMDKIGKTSLEKRENLYVYKNSVGIPPLEMIDDVVSIAECGVESIKSNTFVNSSIEMKKLPLNVKKCKKIAHWKSEQSLS